MYSTKKEEEQERGWWWHWQNLKKERGALRGVWQHGRAWLHRRPEGVIGVEWCIPAHDFHISIVVGGMEDQLRLSFAPWLFALYVTFERWPWLRKWEQAKDWRAKETSFAIHNGSLWWKVWSNEDEWNKRTPKWRDSSFNVPNFLLGREQYSEVAQEPVAVSIPMPEGEYPAMVKLLTATWKRPRWPRATIRQRADIEVQNGVPIPGKGENSWDCDDDAMFSLLTSATTAEEAVQQFVAAVNRQRERYGGEGWLPAARQ